jgi:diacylglycerol kinase (ATP)
MLLIVNPTARAGRTADRRAYWLDALRRQCVPFAVAETRHAGEAAALARDAREPVVVAVGGDGTINEVMDGVLQSPVPKTLGVLYCGTSPDFCRFHGIPFSDPAAALNVLLRSRVRRVDVARITCAAAPPSYFACGCNVGLGSRVAAFANAHRRHLGDAAGTALGLMLAVARQRRFAVRLELDGDPIALGDVNHVLILKNPHIASGLKLNLPLTPDDGRMTVLALHHLSRLALLRLIPAFYSGRAADSPAVLRRDCRRVTLTAEPRQAVEFDGDPRTVTPIDVSLLPRALALICEAKHA